MTPAARVQTAIELLDAIIAAARDGGAAADVIATRFFKERRYAGSKDRRAIRDLAWAAIRRFGERPANGRAAMVALADDDVALAALFTGEPRAPAAITATEPRASGGPLPAWLTPLLDPHIDAAEAAALLERAPLDLRINRARADGIDLPEGAPLPAPLDGLRLPADTSLAGHPAMLGGAIEVQDAGSQWIAATCAVRPGVTVIDLCAGAGGKTLALAAAMAGKGRLIACDTDRRRLSELPPRAARAGAAVETRLLDPGREAAALADLAGDADVVLVDAPCSGSGTWRRNPEARWRLNRERLDRLLALQAHVLDVAAPLVRPGGCLVYAVCALTSAEGEAQVDAFLRRHPRFTAEAPDLPVGRPAGAGIILTPAHDATDGFFIARMQAG
jgi:16S rRNA (cytosine967-C5)-methyltransferase